MTETYEDLMRINADLQDRLDAAEEALRAIQSGEVDALVIYRDDGEQVYTLEGELEITSRPGQGTKLRVVVPVDPPQAPSSLA